MVEFSRVDADAIGWLTTDQMVEVDRIMIDELHIELIQMMENAGRNLARLAIDRYSPSKVVVCAGTGGNGGGGLVAARHLHVAGVDVEVVLSSDADGFSGVPLHQLDVVTRLGVDSATSISAEADLIVDALIGYSLRGAPRGRVAELISEVNAGAAPVLALDTPSGLDTTTGTAHDPHISADATLTLALPKVGLRDQPSVGELFVADISVPPSVYVELEAGPAPDFSRGSIVAVS